MAVILLTAVYLLFVPEIETPVWVAPPGALADTSAYHAVPKPTYIRQMRYTAVPFDSLQDLYEYAAQDHLTTAVVLEVRKGRWYTLEAQPAYVLKPMEG